MSRSVVLAPTREELRRAVGAAGPGRVALVPTMGALHAGHAALVRRARAEVTGPVVVSVFVNPLQFAPGEDLDRYPRTLEADLDVCAEAGADIVFAPAVEEVYPGGLPVPGDDGAADGVTVDPGALATVLEGASRPTHFRGVLTVVAKLFALVRPDVAVFGEKDYQQLALIRRMVEDLCLDIEVIGAETVRDPDGLALSSRNRFLAPQERAAALALSRALRAAQERARYGVPAARWAAMRELQAEPGLVLDYLALRSPDLTEIADDHPASLEARVLVAARVGSTRLIDNLPVHLGSATAASTETPEGGS
ncbi:MAG: pantoate--beta-alanine ligase [Marmoricola sp.]